MHGSGPAEDVLLRSRGEYGIFSAASSASVVPNAATGGSSVKTILLQTGRSLTPCLHLLRVHVTSCDFVRSHYRERSTTDRVGSHRL